MSKLLLIYYSFNGTKHSCGYCSGALLEDTSGMDYQIKKYTRNHKKLITFDNFGFVNKEKLDIFEYESSCCEVPDGSGYCNTNVLYKAKWVKLIDKKVLSSKSIYNLISEIDNEQSIINNQ